MKKITRRVFNCFLVFCIFGQILATFPMLSAEINTENNESKIAQDFLKTSDVAGSDLYAEQISAYVAGSKSIIRQSCFTNDTNILSGFDSNDPAFYKCNILLSASNGVKPGLFPNIITDNLIGSQFSLSYNNFVGFLYYDDVLGQKDAEHRAERALEIIRRKFQIDLIMINVSEPNFFPFVGYHPEWDMYLEELTQNLPMDGYWKALDIDRLTSDDYLENHHLSTSYLLINSLDFLDQGVNISTDQINFNFEAMDLSFMEDVELSDLISQMGVVFEEYGSLLGNYTEFSSEDMIAMSEAFGSIALSNDSHYTTMLVQYEGRDKGITNTGSNQYKFNLYDALGYDKALHPSEKIYIAMIGAFMSEIDINILGTEIIDFTPKYFEFYDYMLEQLGLILFYAGVDFDVEMIKEYNLELFWVNEDGVYRNYVKPVNLNDPNDPVNYLQLYGFQGIPFIPTGVLNPISDLIVTYKVSYSEPNMVITKDLIGENASYGAYQDFSFNITAEVVGNETVWGVPYSIDVDLSYILTPILYNLLLTYVNLMPGPDYNTLEEYFGMDEDPRIFFFDTWGVGINDYFFPDVTDTGNWLPYSIEFAQFISDNIPEAAFGGAAEKQAAINLFLNEESIWNQDNWKLEPGEIINYTAANLSIAFFDTFSPFYSYNFTIKDTFPELPALIYGTSLNSTIPEMALEQDNVSWEIGSEQRFVDQHELELQFLFKNDTKLDLENNTLQQVAIVINYTTPTIDSLDIEVYNFSTNQWIDVTPFTIAAESYNNSWTFAFIERNTSLDWIFDPSAPENHTVLFRIKGTDGDFFNMSINDLNIRFAERQVNAYNVPSSRVTFASSTGNTQFTRSSNSFMLCTYDMASISATSNITKYNSQLGDLNTYTLHLKNVGSDDAINISTSIMIPGIINKSNDFVVRNNYLIYNLPILAPGEEKVINFTFHTPNSESLEGVTILYNSTRKIDNQNGSLFTITNDVYYSSPVDYKNRIPYVRTIEISYSSTDMAPMIGSSFNLTAIIKNAGPNGIKIPDLNLTMNDQYGDLIRVDNNGLSVTDIKYGEFALYNITLKKNNWKGYFYPAINFIQSSESRTIQISKSKPIILGSFSFSIEKSIDANQIEIGDIIEVSIEVENRGNICVKNVTLNDMVSFTQIEFSLVDGKLVHEIECLEPGETIEYSYKIQAKSQSLVTLKPAWIDYYYLNAQTDKSDELEIKIIIQQEIQILAILIPCGLALAILGLFYWQRNKYKAEKYELQRADMILFSLDSSESILRIEHTLRERLSILEKGGDILPEPEEVKLTRTVDFEKERFCPRCGEPIRKMLRTCNLCKMEISEIDPIGDADVNLQKLALIALTDADENKRKEAVDKMGNSEDLKGLGVIAHLLLNDPSDDVRREAADELGDLHHIYSIDALQKALKDESISVRKEVIKCLREVKKQNELLEEDKVKKELAKKEPAKPPEKKEPVKKATIKEEIIDFDILYKKTVKELLVFAKENGIEIPPRTKKAEIVQMIVDQMQNKEGGSKK